MTAALPVVDLGAPPVELPPRLDGRPTERLSYSALSDLLCPEAYRRKRILGQRKPPVGTMVCGSAVDDAVGAACEELIAGGTLPSREAAGELFDARWARLVAEQEGPLAFDGEDSAERAERGGRECTMLYVGQVLPAYLERGWSVSEVQGRRQFALAPGLRWEVIGYLDLALVHEDGRRLVIDLKTGGSTWKPAKAEQSLQADIYLLAEALEGRPATGFEFHRLNRLPKGRLTSQGERVYDYDSIPADEQGKDMGMGGKDGAGVGMQVLSAERAVRDFERTRAAICLAARQVVALYEGLGPERPWPMLGFVDPSAWKCSERFCDFWASCVGGGLLR